MYYCNNLTLCNQSVAPLWPEKAKRFKVYDVNEPVMNELGRVENQARLANKQEILVAAKKQLYQTSWLNIKVNQWKLRLMSCERKRAAARELQLHLFSCRSYLVGFFVLFWWGNSSVWAFGRSLCCLACISFTESSNCVYSILQYDDAVWECFFPTEFPLQFIPPQILSHMLKLNRMWEVKFRSIHVSGFAYKLSVVTERMRLWTQEAEMRSCVLASDSEAPGYLPLVVFLVNSG